jgi:hypothetical protein
MAGIGRVAKGAGIEIAAAGGEVVDLKSGLSRGHMHAGGIVLS